jgi:phage terminase large subunit
MSDYNTCRHSTYAEITWAICQYNVSTMKRHDFGDVLKIDKCFFQVLLCLMLITEAKIPA